MREDAVTRFSARAARATGALALLSLVASFWLLLSPVQEGVQSADADGYSRSAIGHLGLLRLLQELREPALQLRLPRNLADCGLLVLAEPGELDAEEVEAVQGRMAQAHQTLLVLSKRSGDPDQGSPWLQHSDLVQEQKVRTVLQQITGRSPKLLRTDVTASWHDERGWQQPVLAAPAQLLDAGDDAVEPMLWCDQGVLLARVHGTWVLSDPDLIANHGLHRGDNAELAVAMLRFLREGDSLVFDETIHGHRLQPSIWKALGRWPLVLVPAHLLVLLAFTLWIARGRFGPVQAVPPAIDPGKSFLIDNIAALLRRGGQHGPSLRRYGRNRVRRAAERMHAPRELADEQCVQWLLRRIPEPAVRRELAELLEQSRVEMQPHHAVHTAARIHELTEELHAVH